MIIIIALLLVLAAISAMIIFSRSHARSLQHLVDIAETALGSEHMKRKWPGKAGRFLALEIALKNMVEELSRRAQQAEAEGRQLNAILNGMSEAVLAVDDSLTLYLANPRARSLFGLGSSAKSSLLAATRSTELENIARRVLAEGQPLEMELSLWAGYTQTRTEQRFQVFATPLSANIPKQQGGVVIVMKDITRLARLEQVRKDFIANVSHELRTPIHLIKGYSETMLDTPYTGEQFHRYMEIIYKNAETMENLTNDLLVLSNLENTGNDHPDISGMMKKQRLAPLLAEAVSSVEPQAMKKKIKITVHCPSNLEARVHGPFIIQALINLLDNGIKYSPKKTRLLVSANRENENVVLAVKDEGIGIPAEHLERIFERFYRVDRAHSKETGGTGLGLSIVRHIALMHNGTTEVESHAGEGSVFRIRI
jgi:two-component system phosphate regulon sensor histidine kinase PhoR